HNQLLVVERRNARQIEAGLLASGSTYWPRLPALSAVALTAFVPGYSGGTATELHRFPYSFAHGNKPRGTPRVRGENLTQRRAASSSGPAPSRCKNAAVAEFTARTWRKAKRGHIFPKIVATPKATSVCAACFVMFCTDMVANSKNVVYNPHTASRGGACCAHIRSLTTRFALENSSGYAPSRPELFTTPSGVIIP